MVKLLKQLDGANPVELQIAPGHTTLEMTRRYAQAPRFKNVFRRHVVASPVDRLKDQIDYQMQ